MKALAILAACLLWASPAFATLWYVDSNATGANDGTTFLNARAALQAGLNDVDPTNGDEIYIASDHLQTGTTWTLTCPNDTVTQPVVISSRDSTSTPGSEVYKEATTIQLEATAAGGDITFDCNFIAYGMSFKAGDDIILNSSLTHYRFWDTTFEMATSGSRFIPKSLEMRGGTINFSHASGGQVETGSSNKFMGVSFIGTAASQLFRLDTQQGWTTCIGCDFSSLTSGTTLVLTATSNSGFRQLDIVSSRLPASFVIASSTVLRPNEIVRIINSDTTGASPEGDRSYNEWISVGGSVTTDTDTYLTAGWDDAIGGRMSHEFATVTAASFFPLKGIPSVFFVSSTGSKTFDIECVHNFGTNPDSSQLWMDVHALETTNGAGWTRSSTLDPDGSDSIMSPGDGTGAWTDPPADAVSLRLSKTIDVDAIGLHEAIVYLKKFESGKVMHCDPVVEF